MEPGCSLLLVDDDEEFLEILDRRFKRRGLFVASAIDPQSAMEAASQGAFHVAVVDRSLPGQDGVELMLRLLDRHPQLRVILLSGHGDEETIAHARGRGAFDYLVKPCSFADLEAAVTRAYDASRAAAPG
ncbi:MAG TPA: response regulator [Pirellulales bacterium]|nr:response regulator [Pirellulales bacterium]